MSSGMKKYLIFILPLFFAVISFNNVSAAKTSNDDLYKKSLVMGIKTCYNLYAKDSIAYKDFSDYKNIFKSGYDTSSNSDVWIPTHVGNSLNYGNYRDSNLSCGQVFAGYKSQAKGLKDYYTIPDKMTKLGYEFSYVDGTQDDTSGTAEALTDQITFKINYVEDNSDNNSNKMQPIGEGISCNAKQIYHDGRIFKYYYWEITDCSGKTGISYNGEELFVLDADSNDGFLVTGTGTEIFPYNGDHFAPLKYYTFSHTSEKVSLKSEFDKTNFLNMLKTDTETAANKYYSSPSATVGSAISTPKSTDKTNPSSVYKPKNDSKTEAATVLIQNLGASFALIGWTSDDKYSLYYQYLLDIQKSYPDININQCSTEKPSSGWAFKNSSTSWCIINIPTSAQNAKGETLSVFGGSGLMQGTFQNVLEWFNNENNYKNVSEDTYANASTDENGDLIPEASTEDADGDEREATCINSGGAGTLGWIVCPLLESLGGVAEKFYEDQIKGQLQIEPELFTGGNGGTKQGWETFRTIANTAFIIVFLAVIFSQLTGVGINNYGIKKILPKLIVAAILINLSYWLCVALVDISNILGNSLQAMFNNLAEGLTVDSTVITDNAAKEVGTTLASVAIIGALVGTAGLVVWSNPAVILTLLISALGIVISLLFLFILLSVRQAAIVVLVVLSPLAVVAYVLPNTKSLFDKWWKLFKSLLLVYPITGLLVGGGNYVSRLLLSSGLGDKGTFEAATAMIAGIVPVFFIPTGLKNSLAAMGTLGTKLSGMGKTASDWATKKATNSEFNKNAQKMGLERKTRLRAGFNSNGELTRTGRMKAKFARTGVGRFIGSDKRLAIAQNAAKKNINAQEEANATLTNSLARAGIAESGGSPGDYYEQLFLKASQQGDEIGMNSAIAAAVSSGYMKEKDIAKMVRNAENNGNIRFKDAASRAAWLRDTATKYGNGFLATDAELKTFMQKGGDGALGDYGAYAASGGMGIDDFKPEDVSKLSGDSLAGMIASGVLTQGMAKRILASNPNISEDKKIMLSARAEGANVTDAGRFKEEAKALMGNHSATGVTDGSGVTTGFSQIVGTDAATIDRWTANNPLDVHETVRNYQDAQGNVYEVRRSQDGRHTDQGGFDVQIDPTGRNGLKPM